VHIFKIVPRIIIELTLVCSANARHWNKSWSAYTHKMRNRAPVALVQQSSP